MSLAGSPPEDSVTGMAATKVCSKEQEIVVLAGYYELLAALKRQAETAEADAVAQPAYHL